MGTNNPRENAFDRNETKIDGCIIDWPAPLLSQTLLETEPSFISTLDEVFMVHFYTARSTSLTIYILHRKPRILTL